MKIGDGHPHGVYGHLIACFNLPDKGPEQLQDMIEADRERSAEHKKRALILLNLVRGNN